MSRREQGRGPRWHCPVAPALGAHHPPPLSPGTLKALLFILASVGAWYSGYLLAELIPDEGLAGAVASVRGFGDRLVLQGQYRASQQASGLSSGLGSAHLAVSH